MIKISHTGTLPHNIPLMVQKSDHTTVVINLEPNQYFFADTNFMTRPMIIHEKKRHISIDYTTKPIDMDFYKTYLNEPYVISVNNNESINTNADSTPEITPQSISTTEEMDKTAPIKKRGRPKATIENIEEGRKKILKKADIKIQKPKPRKKK
jgi:hypothetical protein